MRKERRCPDTGSPSVFFRAVCFASRRGSCALFFALSLLTSQSGSAIAAPACHEKAKAIPYPGKEEIKEFVSLLNRLEKKPIRGCDEFKFDEEQYDLTAAAGDRLMYYISCTGSIGAGGLSLFKGDINNDGKGDKYVLTQMAGSLGLETIEAVYERSKDGLKPVPLFENDLNDIGDRFAVPFLTTACGKTYINFSQKDTTRPDVFLWKGRRMARQSALPRLKLTMSGNDALCRSMMDLPGDSPLHVGQVKVPEAATRLKEEDITSHKAVELGDTAIGRLKFDIDNDGKEEVVYAFHPQVHSAENDEFIVSPGPDFDASVDNGSMKLSLIDNAKVSEKSPFDFPQALADCGAERCNSGNTDPDNSPKIGNAHFRFRYLHAVPFIYEGATYFLLWTTDEGNGVSLAVRLDPAHRLTEICAFDYE